MTEHQAIPSPCIRRCTLNDQDVCIGCGRTLNDIKQWSNATRDQQIGIIQKSNQRLMELNQGFKKR